MSDSWRRHSHLTDIRQIPTGFEARFALLTDLCNGKLLAREQEALEAAGWLHQILTWRSSRTLLPWSARPGASAVANLFLQYPVGGSRIV